MHAFIFTAFRLLYDTSIDTILYSNCVCFMFVPNLTFNKIIEMSQQKATHKTIFKISYNENIQQSELYARSLCSVCLSFSILSHKQFYRTITVIIMIIIFGIDQKRLYNTIINVSDQTMFTKQWQTDKAKNVKCEVYKRNMLSLCVWQIHILLILSLSLPLFLSTLGYAIAQPTDKRILLFRDFIIHRSRYTHIRIHSCYMLEEGDTLLYCVRMWFRF